MRRLHTILLLMACVMSALAQAPSVKLKQGDTLSVVVFGFEQYKSECIVLSDGSIIGNGFGQLPVVGKTPKQVEALITKRLKKHIKEPYVTVLLDKQRPDTVFLTGAKTPDGGAIPLGPNMDLRQLVAMAELPSDADLLDAHLVRSGETIQRVRVIDILRGRAKEGAIKLQPYDVVSILPLDYVRVWVTGAVAKSGQLRVREGVDVYKAVAEAGGIDPKQDPSAKPVVLEAGDEIIVQAPKQVRVTVGGEVEKPGEVNLREGTPVLTAISQAGGATREGTLTSILVQRKGEWLQINATAAPTGGAPALVLQDGDYVFVRKNERAVIAVGQVQKPGRILFEDNKTYRVLDVIAEAGGVTERGTLVRVYLGRPGPDGKMKVRELRVDKVTKTGDVENNPEVLPGDVIMVGEPKSSSKDIGTVLSGALGIFSFLRL